MVKLTPREKQVCRFLVQGMSNKEIATKLGISVRSTKQYVRMLFLKFDVTVEEGSIKNKRVVLAIQLSRLQKSNSEYFEELLGGIRIKPLQLKLGLQSKL